MGKYEDKKEEGGVEKEVAGDSLLKATFIQGKFNAPPSPYVNPKLQQNTTENSYQVSRWRYTISLSSIVNTSLFSNNFVLDVVTVYIAIFVKSYVSKLKSFICLMTTIFNVK